MGYKEIALPLAQRGVPTTVIKAKSKAAFMQNWQTNATIDPGQIEAWDNQFPGSNAGSVAIAQLGQFWFFEIDSAEVWNRIETETGNKIPNTFRVRSSPGRGHFYWKQSPASLAMGNIAQTFVKHGDWSARVDREYVVSPGSMHPTSGRQYEVMSSAPIVEAPDWLILWCISQKLEIKAPTAAAVEEDHSPVLEGGRNSWLASQAGKMRQVAEMDAEMIHNALVSLNEKRCKPPLPDEEVRTIAYSIGRYPIKDTTVLVGGVPAGSGRIPIALQREIEKQQAIANDPEDCPERKPVPYPKFPYWVMLGTSIYEGLVKPICDQNSRYPEYMFMPAITLLLNYVGLNVRIANTATIPSIFMVSIGRRGETIKSGSVESAMEYFQDMNFLDHASASIQTADSKSYVYTVGSTEGLGVEMQRTNCKHAVLYYDELSVLVNKAGIESSSLQSHLLEVYGSAKFSNGLKGRKESFNIPPKTYIVSLIACCTDKNFQKLWSKLAGESSGLNDRFFFLYQPEKFQEKKLRVTVPTYEGAQKTKALIEKAIMRGIYTITDDSPLKEKINDLDNREMDRVEKFALYFAIDLGLDEIDLDCLERALDLIDYEKKVKAYLMTYEADTKEAQIQQDIRSILRRNNFKLSKRDVERIGHSNRVGTSLWQQALTGLLRTGQIVQAGEGTKTSPTTLELMIVPDPDDD